MKPLATAAFAALGLALAGCTNDPNVVVTGTVTFPQPGAWNAALTIRRGTFDAETIKAIVPVSR